MTIAGETHMTQMLYAIDGHCKTLAELCVELKMNNRQVSDAAAKLVIQGYAERVSLGCFQLTTGGREAVADGCTLTSGPNAPHRQGQSTQGRNTAPAVMERNADIAAFHLGRPYDGGGA